MSAHSNPWNLGVPLFLGEPGTRNGKRLNNLDEVTFA